MLESAIELWATDNSKIEGDTCSIKEIVPTYIKDKPICPAGGVYSSYSISKGLFIVGVPPVCSIHCPKGINEDADIKLEDIMIGKNPPLKLVSFHIRHESYKNIITLEVCSNSDTEIQAWKGKLIVTNSWGEKVTETTITDNNASIKPRSTDEGSWGIDELAGYSERNLKIELKGVKVIFTTRPEENAEK